MLILTQWRRSLHRLLLHAVFVWVWAHFLVFAPVLAPIKHWHQHTHPTPSKQASGFRDDVTSSSQTSILYRHDHIRYPTVCSGQNNVEAQNVACTFVHVLCSVVKTCLITSLLIIWPRVKLTKLTELADSPFIFRPIQNKSKPQMDRLNCHQPAI